MFYILSINKLKIIIIGKKNFFFFFGEKVEIV